ncbi:MAG: YraN family protein [Candidatus Omnitrophota bacterium]|nr:YraN family protein [Candidatus Omnitrophota bacterium]
MNLALPVHTIFNLRKGGVKTKNLEVGRIGEVIAKKYLRNNGYRIIEQNYKTKYAEIDLIARYKGALVFVEVKTRIGERFGAPEESINRDKMYKLIKNARGYTAWKKYRKAYRIDAIGIVLDENKKLKRLNHYKNITS